MLGGCQSPEPARRIAAATYLTAIPEPKTLGETCVSDPDGILPPGAAPALNIRLDSLDQSGRAPIDVVLVRSLGEVVPKTAATALFTKKLFELFWVMKDVAALPQRKAYSSDLSAHDWQRLEPVLLAHVQRRSKWPLPELVNAILQVLKSGCLWRDVPGEFPPWGTVYWYFSKWQNERALDKINACLVANCREQAQKKSNPAAS